MQISNAIVHQIIKGQYTSTAEINYREKENEIEENLEQLVEDLRQIYNTKSNRGYGIFENDQNSGTPNLVEDYFSQLSTGNIPFVQFSKNITHEIKTFMEQAPASTGGYALFIKYQNSDRDYIMIAMLKDKASVGINDDLELNQHITLDLEHLNEVARIDLVKWQEHSESSYLSFVKCRNNDDATNYFRSALRCSTYTSSISCTQDLLKAVTDFSQERNMTEEEKTGLRDDLYRYLFEKDRNKQPVILQDLSNRIFGEDSGEFISYINNNETYNITDEFKPHKKTFETLKRLKVTMTGVKLQFEQSAINDTIIYDETAHSITIENIPQTEIEKIERFIRGN